MDIAKGDRGDIVAEEIGKIRALRRGRHKRKRGGHHALHASNGRRQYTHLMPAATGRGVIIVAEMKPDIVQHALLFQFWRRLFSQNRATLLRSLLRAIPGKV